jgi:BirA family transcriptional regulator, biotin operon repressor / biotin---[acetyl-CoA-carboxylase] ligase
MFAVGEISKEWCEKSQIPVWYEMSTSSTNTIAKTKLISDQPISVYLTNHQTSGRGRGEHTWSDTSGGQFLSSWVFQMRQPPQPVLSPALGLAVWTAMRASFPWLALSLKAPNDLYLGDKKLAGLLIENVASGNSHRLIVGIGLNVWKSPADVSTSVCLADHCASELTPDLWLNVMDRLLLELSLAVSQTRGNLKPQQQQSLKQALNLFPGLAKPYTRVDEDGSLWVGTQKINWSEL